MVKPSDERPTGRAGLWATAIILALLVATGLIPWVGVLRGRPPAYTAEIGAAIAVVGAALLLVTVREIIASLRREHDDDTRD